MISLNNKKKDTSANITPLITAGIGAKGGDYLGKIIGPLGIVRGGGKGYGINELTVRITISLAGAGIGYGLGKLSEKIKEHL